MSASHSFQRLSSVRGVFVRTWWQHNLARVEKTRTKGDNLSYEWSHRSFSVKVVKIKKTRAKQKRGRVRESAENAFTLWKRGKRASDYVHRGCMAAALHKHFSFASPVALFYDGAESERARTLLRRTRLRAKDFSYKTKNHRNTSS